MRILLILIFCFCTFSCTLKAEKLDVNLNDPLIEDRLSDIK